MKILLFGATGFLGTYLKQYLYKYSFLIYTIGRSHQCDISVDFNDLDSLSFKIEEIKPDIIINMIAVTNVDICEEDASSSSFAHITIPESIASAINRINFYDPHIIHISTDQVYSGNGPHKENKTNPVNIYAKTKLSGELVFNKMKSTIIRTNFVGKGSKKLSRESFSDWLFRSLKNKDEITVFEDVYFNPLRLQSLARVILHIIELGIFGIYNVGSNGSISKANFAFKFAEQLGCSSKHLKIGFINDLKLKAIRPNDMTMNINKIESKLKMKLPTIESEINNLAREYI